MTMFAFSETNTIAVLSWVPCLVIGFISLCRLNAMTERVAFRVRIEYSIYIGIATLVPLGPFMGEWPTPLTFLIVSGLAVILLCSQPAWHDDRPPLVAMED